MLLKSPFRSAGQDRVKRLLDVCGSAAGLIVFAPLFAAIAIQVRLSSPGRIFYRGVRVGRHGRPFRIYKFRTMVENAETLGGSATADDDPRLTRTGLFLRKCKLDELPQLLNVLTGEMSLVGPRPEVRKYVDQYTREQKAILNVRPGITDWASIWNCDEGNVLAGSGDPERLYEELIRPTKLALQQQYVRSYGIATDLRILWCTLRKLFQKTWVPKELSGCMALPAASRPAWTGARAPASSPAD